MKVTSLQLDVASLPKAERLERALALVDSAAGSDLILLPELWHTGYFNFEGYKDDASPLFSNAAIAALSEKARKLNAYILAGSYVESDAGKLYNTTVLLDRAGKTVAKYRKIHLFGFRSKERDLLTAGREVSVVDTPWGKAGLSTCYDLRFPEFYRKMLDQGAEYFLVVAAWPQARVESWKLFTRARAHENLAYLFSCNCAGDDHNTRLGGCSQFVDPLGKVAAAAGEDACSLSADVDMAAVAKVRSEFSALNDRVFVS